MKSMSSTVERTSEEDIIKILVEQAPVGVSIVQDGKFCYVNSYFSIATGYTADELMGKDSFMLIVPEDREMVRENTIKMLKEEFLTPYQFRVTCKDGSIIWVMATVKSIQYHRKQAILGNYMEITGRKQTEEALQAEKNKLQAVIGAIEYGLTIQDRDYNIIYQNEPSKITYDGDHVGEKCYRIYASRDKVCPKCPVAMAFRDGKSHTVESRKVMPSGEVAFWENTASPIRDAKGEIVSCLEVTRNISARKKQEQELADELTRRRLLVDQSLDGIVVLDVDAGVVEANQRFAEMLGYTPEEVHELHTWDWDKNYTREQILELGRNVDEQGIHLETKQTRKDGSVIDVDISISGIMYRGRKLIFCIQRDVTERNRAEEALREAEEEKSAFLEEAPVGIIHADLKGNITYVNKRFESETGYSREEIIGKSGLQLDWFPASTMKYLPKRMAARLRGSPAKHWETKFKCKDGRWIWIELEGKILRKLGVPVGFQIIAGNVTERKQAEEALRQSEERYRTILEEMEDAYFEVDLGGHFTFVNNSVCRDLGYSREELMGMSYKKFTVEEDIESVFRIFSEVYQSGVPNKGFPWKTVRKDGVCGFAETSVSTLRNDKDEIIGFRGIGRDITERRRVEEALRLAAEEWRETFDSITDAISIHDRDHKILRANKAFADIFHVNPSQFLGKHCYKLHKEEKPISGCPHKQTLATGKPAVTEFYESNLGKYLLETTSPIFDKTGEVIGIVHITRDITEQKQQNERLIMTDRLASIGELASGAAHELNNPLASIIGFSQLLMEKEAPDDIREDLKIINNEAQRAAIVTNNLLAFARKHAPMKQPNQINNIIEDVLELRAREHKVNHIDVESHLAPNLPEILVDYFQMQQVFMNIIINAEYFITKAHNGGTLTIATQKENSIVRISIADDGPGISPENLGRIFDPFFTTKEAGSGTGLGLSICHGIVNEHGGQIYVRSQLGKGATILIELPIKNRAHIKSLL